MVELGVVEVGVLLGSGWAVVEPELQLASVELDVVVGLLEVGVVLVSVASPLPPEGVPLLSTVGSVCVWG